MYWKGAKLVTFNTCEMIAPNKRFGTALHCLMGWLLLYLKKTEIGKQKIRLSGHFREPSIAETSTSKVILEQTDGDDEENLEFSKKNTFSLINVTGVDDSLTPTAVNRPRKRLRVRVPISRGDGNHKVTVVRRRPLGPNSRTQKALSAPRRFIVTRVRTPGVPRITEYDGPGQEPEVKAEEDFSSPAYRHKVTVTRLRKIQPTSVNEETVKPRVTRKKLVNVRPVLLPTPTSTSTLAIITTGFYEAPASNDEDSDEYEEEDVGGVEYDQDLPKNDDLSTATPSLEDIPNTIDNRSNEMTSPDGERVTESNLLPESTPEAPVILTEHFFLPSEEGDEDYYDEDVDTETNPTETETTTESSTSEPVSTAKLSPDLLDPSPSVSIQESPVLSEEKHEPMKTPSLDVEIATNSEPIEVHPEATNSMQPDGKTSVYLTMDDVVVGSTETLKNSSTSTVELPGIDATRIPAVSAPVLEDVGAMSSDDPSPSLSQVSSVSDLSHIPEAKNSALESPESTAIVYYSETVVTSTRLRTYTYVVTKLNGLQTEVTSSTAVRPKVTTLTLTVPVTATLPNAAVATTTPQHPTSTVPQTPASPKPFSPVYSPETIHDDESAKEEPAEDEQGRRFNLATRRMSNGVQVIVAGPTPAPAPRWETASPPATLTLSDAVVMLMPRDKPQEFVTKTCATTFTYLTTFTDQDGSSRVSTKHQVVYNTATEERHLPPDQASPALGFTLEASPTLGTEVFETTYAYLDLPVDSRGSTVITNTVTAPQRYLDLVLEPSEAPLPETNTYLSTRTLERTVTENGKATVHAVNDVVTRLVVTESARSPRPSTSVDVTLTGTNGPEETPSTSADVESDVVKTYYVTYSYYSTFLEKGSTVVRTNIATSSDVVTEKVPGRRTSSTKTASTVETRETPQTPVILATSVTPETPTTSTNPEPIQIFATKTYLTTFTYFTTLLQAGANGETSTTVSSRSQIVENVVTESIAPSLLDAGYNMNAVFTTSQPQKEEQSVDKPSDVNQVNNVVTGSTIIFFDEEDRIDPTSTSSPITTSATEMVSVSSATSSPETHPTTVPTTGEDAKVPEGNNDAPAAGSGSFGTLGPFGSFGINGLSALGPVITAMAGLLQGKTTASRRNGTSDDGQEHQDTTTQRSPIYIPVAEFADGDIETAESQNIGNRLANLNRNYIPETRHKSSASLVNGIPISPGEVITANSDVIIGKPGKIGGPRPPQTYNREDEHVGIRPPPPPSQGLLKPAGPHVHRATLNDHHETQLQILPARQVFEEHLQIPVEYGIASAESHQVQSTAKHPQRLGLRTDPAHDIMVNDPLLKPPASPSLVGIDRGKPSYPDRNPGPDPNEPAWSPEKYRRPWSAKDPLKPLETEETLSSGTQWIRNDAEEAASSSSKGTLGKPNSWPNHNDYHSIKEHHERPPWAQRDPLLPSNTIAESSPQPNAPEPTSIIRHLVPHVIDRDTGQPLLVNIQPSQVANVVIPQGGNQALIFGDTNEPHITGQYFDDPSPYPEPEVAPGFVGVQKVEHSPQYFSQDNPSEYMVPPPTPQVNFKPLSQSSGGRPPPHHERPAHGRPGNFNQIQRRPATQPATSPPRRTEVETPPHRYILLGKPGDSRPVNELPSDSGTWKLKGDRKPGPPQSTTQSAVRQRPSGHFGSGPTRPTFTPHGHDIYVGRPGSYPVRNPQYPVPPPPSPYRPLTKKPDVNLVPPNWTPPKNPFNREQLIGQSGQDHENDIIVTITETVPVNPEGNDIPQILHPTTFQVNVHHEAPQYPLQEKINPLKIDTTETSIVHQSTGESLPTGAIEYHDPSTDPKVKPEDTSYFPRVPTVKPEVQSFGQILPHADEDGVPEIWTANTQTERSSLSNDSDISGSEKVRIHTNVPTRGDMPPEIDNDTDFESDSDLPFNFVTPGTRDSFDGIGSVTTVVGKPLEAEQAVAYGHQQQKKHEQQLHQQQHQGQNNSPPHRGVPFAHRDKEPAIVQGVPFRQDPYDGTKTYERPMIVKGKPFGVYVDGHVNVGRPYGYDERETRRPPMNHDVVQGVPFGHHGGQKPTIHEVPVPPRKDGEIPSISSPMDRNDSMDLKPPPVTVGFHQHQVPGPFAPNRISVTGNDGPDTRPELATLPPTPSSALSPPAKPDQMNKDFGVASGNRTRPSSMGSGNYYEDETGSELNLAESSYQLPHLIGTSAGQPRPQDGSGSLDQGRPNFPQDVTRPRPHGANHHQSQPTKDRVEHEFSMAVEATGDDNEDSDTQTERPPSMFSMGTTTTRKTPTQLPTLPTILAAPPPTSEVSINRKDSMMNLHQNKTHTATQEPVAIPQPRPRPRVPYRDMMPPPLRPSIVFLGSKGNGNDNKAQSEGLEPPPLPTDVVGLSPPPPKYIPLEESTTSAPRPFLVELLSQDMVPPAPVIETVSRPVAEIATVRPAVAVSGSIRIATSAIATSHVPMMHENEGDIPIVHGTVDLPVIVEMHGPPPSSPSIIAPKTSKFEHVSIYTARPFESRPVSRVSIQPTAIISSTSSSSSGTTQRPHSVDHIEPSTTVRVTVKATKVSSPTTELVTDDPTTTKRPGGPVKPVFLQPSKDADIPSFAVQPTQSLASVDPGQTSSVTKPPIIIDEKPTPKTPSSRTKQPEVKTTSNRPTEDLIYTKPTTEATRNNETERETVLYVVTTRVASVSASTTRTLLLTRTLTSTMVETVTETLVQPASPTTIISSSTILRPIIRDPAPKLPSENESIFVVMSDQNPPEPGAEQVEAEYGDVEEATRDEQDPVGNTIQQVVVGGILGAPVFPREPTAGRCIPECRASKAEVCSEFDGDFKCVCRPGFARMFLDRPCKPIYTYTLRVGLDRVGKEPVSAYAAGLNDTESTEYQKLAGPTKEALDRTMMQSDLRDSYRGLDVARFTTDPDAGVEFNVQFSENANETRLKEVVRKYLLGNNYSLGGTEVYASRDLDSVDVTDFDECATEEGGPHHDCSPHAACFNLRGSYQCSCREGWADLSDNLPAYPGRVCSQAPLGCPACNNKGHCVFNTNGQEVCECFPWHSGQRCQVNLKVLLIALVTTGIVLLVLLGACLGLACFGRPGRRSGNRSGDRRAMIPGGGNGGDTSSEGSVADLATIPHHVPHVLPAPPQIAAPAPPSKRPSGPKRNAPSFAPPVTGAPIHPRHPRGSALLPRPRDSVRSKSAVQAPAEDQRDRSLTVMIPRAKYRSAPQSPQSPGSCKPPGSNLAVDERKLISYLEAGPRPETRKPSLAGKRDSVCKEIIVDTQQANRSNPNNSHLPVGALVSAGFQVSATVTRQVDAESTLARSCGETTVETSTKILRSNDVLRGDLGSTLARSCGETTIQPPTKLLRMDLGEAGSTLARSCGETTIQPPTKIAADRRGSREPRDNASDGHTMAERDVGGTLRMPAQRPPFYDPDRASDRESNFDSL